MTSDTFRSRRSALLTAFLVSLAIPGTGATLLEVRREANDTTIRLVLRANAPMRFDYRSKEPLHLQLVLNDTEPGALGDTSDAWAPEVESLSIRRHRDELRTTIEVRFVEFQPYTVKSEGMAIVITFGKRKSEQVKKPPASRVPAE